MAIKPLGNIFIFVLVFAVLGQFLPKVGPRTPLNGSGSKMVHNAHKISPVD